MVNDKKVPSKSLRITCFTNTVLDRLLDNLYTYITDGDPLVNVTSNCYCIVNKPSENDSEIITTLRKAKGKRANSRA